MSHIRWSTSLVCINLGPRDIKAAPADSTIDGHKVRTFTDAKAPTRNLIPQMAPGLCSITPLSPASTCWPAATTPRSCT